MVPRSSVRPLLIAGALFAVVVNGCGQRGATSLETGGGGGGPVTPPSSEGNFGAVVSSPAPSLDPPGTPVLLPPLPGPFASPSPSASPSVAPANTEASPAASPAASTRPAAL